MEDFVINKLNLKLNRKSRYYPSNLGCDFCGYRIYEDYKLLRKRSIKKMRKKIKFYGDDLISYDELVISYKSWLGHARHANSYSLVKSFEDIVK